MTDGVQKGGLAAPLGFGDPVVGLHLRLGNPPLAQRTNRVGFLERHGPIEQFLALDLAQHGSVWMVVYFLRR